MVSLIVILIVGFILTFSKWRATSYSLLIIAFIVGLVSIIPISLSIPKPIKILSFLIIFFLVMFGSYRLTFARSSLKKIKRKEAIFAIVLTYIPKGGEGLVKWGEVDWKAKSLELEKSLAPGEEVIVVSQKRNCLEVLASLNKNLTPLVKVK